MFKLKSVELKLKLETAKDIIIIKVITRNNIGKQSLTKKIVASGISGKYISKANW